MSGLLLVFPLFVVGAYRSLAATSRRWWRRSILRAIHEGAPVRGPLLQLTATSGLPPWFFQDGYGAALRELVDEGVIHNPAGDGWRWCMNTQPAVH